MISGDFHFQLSDPSLFILDINADDEPANQQLETQNHDNNREESKENHPSDLDSFSSEDMNADEAPQQVTQAANENNEDSNPYSVKTEL